MVLFKDTDEDDDHRLHIQKDYLLEQLKDYELDLSEYT